MFDSPCLDKADEGRDPIAPTGAVIANVIAITAEVKNAAALNGANVLTFQLCHEKAASYTAVIDQYCSTTRFAIRLCKSAR
jgi:hypothetical protein